MLEMLCRYRQVDQASGWQVLERIPSRCGAATPLAVIRERMGEAVALPPEQAGSIEVIRVSWRRSLGEAIRTMLYTVLSKDVEYFDAYGPSTNRFLPGTAASTHVMAVPPCIEWNPLFISSGGLRFGLSQDRPTAPSDVGVTVSVFSIPIRC